MKSKLLLLSYVPQKFVQFFMLQLVTKQKKLILSKFTFFFKDQQKIEVSINIESSLSTKLDPDEIVFDPIPIGEGSFGSVHKGQWRGQDVAVKILKYQWVDEEVMRQFDREIDLLNRLRSPYVVNFVGAVNCPGKLYLLTGISFLFFF